MHTFLEFSKYMLENLRELLPAEYTNAKIRLARTNENNGTIAGGISIRPEGMDLDILINLEPHYYQFVNGHDLNEIMEYIAHAITAHFEAYEKLEDFEFVKERIVAAVVNTSRNAEFLKTVPHKDWADLSIIYKVVLDEESKIRIVVQNRYMDAWGTDLDTIHQLAMDNTKQIFPIYIKSIWEQKKLDFIERGIPEAVANSMIPEMSPKETMYIISNGVKEYGAIYMFSEEALSSVAERVGTNLYILPSSTHEVIAICYKHGFSSCCRIY